MFFCSPSCFHFGIPIFSDLFGTGHGGTSPQVYEKQESNHVFFRFMLLFVPIRLGSILILPAFDPICVFLTGQANGETKVGYRHAILVPELRVAGTANNGHRRGKQHENTSSVQHTKRSSRTKCNPALSLALRYLARLLLLAICYLP